jgi:hypothetical protein
MEFIIAYIYRFLFHELAAIFLVMPKEKKSSEKTRPYGLNKKPKTLRFTPDTLRKLREASRREGVTETVYVELALKAQFKKDGIK